MPTDNHDPDNHDPGNRDPGHHAPAPDNRGSEDPINPSPGYERTDVNVGGIIVFLAGLAGFLAVFFIFCFVMGRVINTAFKKEDGPVDRWHQDQAHSYRAIPSDSKRRNLESDPEMEQKELGQMTATFPQPRLDIDDGNQATADLHAREDLLLEHYSTGQDGTTRIPIARAMELIAQRGLPMAASAPAQANQMAGDLRPTVLKPLTTGFARTGYELDAIEARAQKLSYGHSEIGTKQNLQDRH